ncbi:MAG: flagellin [Planctomycetota bacterium]|jgi:flagellin
MLGINTNVGGSYLRTVNNMERVQTELNKSLERIETGNKINRASDDPVGFSKALTLQADIDERNVQVEANRSALTDLTDVDSSISSIITSLQDMREAAVSLKGVATGAAGEDVVAQEGLITEMGILRDSIDAFAVAEFENADLIGGGAAATNQTAAAAVQFGVETSASVNVTFNNMLSAMTGAAAGTSVSASITLLDTAATNVTTANIDNMITAIDHALGEALANGAAMGTLKENVLESAQTLLSSDLVALTNERNKIMAVDDAKESAVVTNLQMRQQALVSSIGVQNAFAASTLDLLG